MTLRDYFAGQALAGLLAKQNLCDTEEQFAKGVYRLADALLAEGNDNNGFSKFLGGQYIKYNTTYFVGSRNAC